MCVCVTATVSSQTFANHTMLLSLMHNVEPTYTDGIVRVSVCAEQMLVCC